MKILIIDEVHKILIDTLSDGNFSVAYFPKILASEVEKKLKNYDGIIVRSKMKITKEIIETAQNLKFIARVGAGLENIDVEFAKQKKITVINSPEGNRDAVGEHAIAMILNLFNKINFANSQVKSGIWDRNNNRGIEIGGKTIGIIGYGNTGSALAKKLSGFDVEILAYDKYKTNFSNEFVKESSLKEIYEKVDILSFHVPLTKETKQMFNTNFVSRFKKPFYLINTSRGEVVDAFSLVNDLKNNKIIGACLDVLEYEKLSFEDIYKNNNLQEFNYLINSDNVILTPHIAGWTHQSYYKISKIIADKIIANFSNS
jgi:D-3-phosphoglycerate dehydrogenase